MYGKDSAMGGLGFGFLDDEVDGGGSSFLDSFAKVVNKVGSVVSDVQKGVSAAQQVQAGNARVSVQPTQQGVQRAVSSYVQANPLMPYLLMGGAGLLLFVLLKRR